MKNAQSDLPLDLLATSMDNNAEQAMIDFGEDFPLHVECGPNQAKLYLNRLKMGSRGACVVFNGAWLTPNQFQAVSGRKTAKDWKRSIKHYGKSLKLLLAKGTLTIEPAECRCENCTGETQEPVDLVAQHSVGSDEENVPPSKAALSDETPLSCNIGSPSGDIADGREYCGAAGEFFSPECHMDRDKRSPPTWNVLSARAGDSRGASDEKSGGCSSSAPTTPSGYKFGRDDTSAHAINGKFSTVAESQVSPTGINGGIAPNRRPAAPATANEGHSPRSESLVGQAASASASGLALDVSSQRNHRRDTPALDGSRQEGGRRVSGGGSEGLPESPINSKELTPGKSPKKTARLTSIIEGLKKNKQENAVGLPSGECTNASPTSLGHEADKKPKNTKRKRSQSRRSSSSSSMMDSQGLPLISSSGAPAYSGALSLALLSNPIYLQSVYPYGVPKDLASMMAAQMEYRQRFLTSQSLLQINTNTSNKENPAGICKNNNKSKSRKSNEKSPSSSTIDFKACAEHLKYDKHGALDLSVRKRIADTAVPENNYKKEAKRPRSDTLHYFPSPPHSPSKPDDCPLQRLEKLQFDDH